MYFVIYALDRPDAQELRARTRAAHREYWRRNDSPVRLRLTGPLMDSDGKNAVGSLIVVQADNLAVVEQCAAQDPYRLAGLVGSVRIHVWNWTAGNPDL